MKMLVFKGDLFIFYFLFVGLSIFGGCGDDDPTDEWIGTWTLETWDGDNWEIDSLKRIWDRKGFVESGGSGTEWDMLVGETKVTTKFTFDNNSHWEYKMDVTMNPSSYAKKKQNNPDRYTRNLVVSFMETLEFASRVSDTVFTGSYIVSEDNFIMKGDSSNTALIGIMSGLWKRTGSKLTLIGDSESRLGTIVLSK